MCAPWSKPIHIYAPLFHAKSDPPIVPEIKIRVDHDPELNLGNHTAVPSAPVRPCTPCMVQSLVTPLYSLLILNVILVLDCLGRAPSWPQVRRRTEHRSVPPQQRRRDGRRHGRCDGRSWPAVAASRGRRAYRCRGRANMVAFCGGS